MATLPEPVLEQGRTHIRNKDIKGLESWLQEHRVPIVHETVLNVMNKCFLVDDEAKALRMFTVIEEIDVDAIKWKRRAITFSMIFIVLLSIAWGVGLFGK